VLTREALIKKYNMFNNILGDVPGRTK